jgi:hypothetical protein
VKGGGNCDEIGAVPCAMHGPQKSTRLQC